MDISNISGHNDWDYCFNTEYIPENETKRDTSKGHNVYTSSLGHVAAGRGHTYFRTSFSPSANEAGKAVLATSVFSDPRWASYDRQGGCCRLKQTVYLQVTAVTTQDFIHNLQHLDHREGRPYKIRTRQVCHYRVDPAAQ